MKIYKEIRYDKHTYQGVWDVMEVYEGVGHGKQTYLKM